MNTPPFIDPNTVAQRLCIKAEKLGLCHPSESMISDCLLDVICNVLNFPIETAHGIPGNEDSKAIKMARDIVSLKMELADVKLQRNALLEMTWLDLPSEPIESTAKWRAEFEKGWERKS